MSHTQRAIDTRQMYPDIEAFGSKVTNQNVGNRTRVGGTADFPNEKQFGQYRADSDAKERLRTFYDTLESVGNNPVATGANSVDRVAPISDAEIATMAEVKEIEKQKEWDAYWLAQCTPAQPWTMTEVAKVAPDLMARRIDTIKNLSQYQLDVNILKHIGHGGDPRLAHLQYMIDQGEMEHMPVMMKVRNAKFSAGPFSIFNIAGGSHTEKESVNLYRSNKEVFGDNQGASLGRTQPAGTQLSRKDFFNRKNPAPL